MARQKLFESQLKLDDSSKYQRQDINWIAIITTALFAAATIVMLGLLSGSQYVSYEWRDAYLLNSFLAVVYFAGYYIYRKIPSRKLTHILITLSIIPLLSYLMVITGLFVISIPY